MVAPLVGRCGGKWMNACRCLVAPCAALMALSSAFAEKGGDKSLTADQARDLEAAARRYFEAAADRQAKWSFDAKLDVLLARKEDAVRQVVWKAYRAAGVHKDAKKDFDAKQVRYEKHTSAYTVKKVG